MNKLAHGGIVYLRHVSLKHFPFNLPQIPTIFIYILQSDTYISILDFFPKIIKLLFSNNLRLVSDLICIFYCEKIECLGSRNTTVFSGLKIRVDATEI